MPGNTPYIIESNVLSQQGQEMAWNQGLYQVGSDLWAFISIVDQVTFDVKLAAFKSDDGLTGHAWTEQGSGPACETVGGGAGASYFGPVGGKMYVAFMHPSSVQLNFVDFTFAGATWGTPVTGGPFFNSPNQPNPQIFRKSGGDFVFTYYDGTNTKVVEYTGSWGSPITVGSSEVLRSSVIDTNDIVHIQTYKSGTGFKYYSFAAGSLSAGVTSLATSTSQNRMGPATYDAGADELIVPYINVVGPVQKLGLLRGTPSAAPVWTNDVAGDSGSFDTFVFPKYFKILGEDYAFVMDSTGTGTFHIELVYYKKTAGVWGSQQVFWDELANPGVPPQDVINDVSLWSAQLLTDGTTLGCTIGLLPLGSAVLCAQQYALIGPFAAGLSLACPIGGGTVKVGVPYSAQIVVTGGTPPYTFQFV
jgi:hypothetical protein